jgi:hypothetical protein
MNYEDMSDFEVNKLVAEKHLKLFVNELRSGGRLNSDVWLFDSEGLVRYTNYNPCNNPSDAWPIIVESEISIEFLDGGYVDVKLDTDFGAFCPDDVYPKERAFEAAMICFLKMKDAEK